MAENRENNELKDTNEVEPVTKKQEKNSMFEEIIKNRDIDDLVHYIKDTKSGNTEEVMDLNPTFFEQHLGGVDMFLELAVKLEPEDPVHHYNRALFFENQKQYDRAQEEYKNAIELDNKNDDYYSEYANLLMALDEYNEAEKQYLEALQINPDNAEAWTNLGILYKNQKDDDKAESALKKAINLDPESTIPYLNLIRLYRDSGKVDDAKNIIQQYKSLQLEDLDLNIMHL